MKKNFIITATFGAFLASSSFAKAEQTFDLNRVIDGALQGMGVHFVNQDQAIDIAKINTVLAEAKDKVIGEFEEFVSSANATFNPTTFNLDTLTLDLTSDVTIKKSVWSQLPSTVGFDFGTKLVGQNADEQKLAAEAGLSLRTQTLALIKYGATRGLEESADDTSEEGALVRDYLNNVLASENLGGVFESTIAFRDLVLASTSDDLESAREFFNALTFTQEAGTMTVALKEMEFFGLNISAKVTVNDAVVSGKIYAVDVAHQLKEQFEANKADIISFLLEIQNANDEIKESIQEGFRGLFNFAREVAGLDQN
jgi:hypothetical protein